jgi:spoIIIJ-associated protein
MGRSRRADARQRQRVKSARQQFKDAAAWLTATAANSSVRGHGEGALVTEVRPQGRKGSEGEEQGQAARREGASGEAGATRERAEGSAERGKGAEDGVEADPEATEADPSCRDSGSSAPAAGPHRKLYVLTLVTSMGNAPIDAEKREEAAKTLREILDRMGIEAEVSAFDDGDRIILDAHGAESGLIIGKKGATLDALQYVINRIISKKPNDGPGVIVDAEGYRGRREDSLADLARRLAEKAIKSGRPVPVEPMSPHDRRIVHVTLAEHPEVTTESEGEGVFRRVVIFPKKSATGPEV